jgi:hypothetical protein
MTACLTLDEWSIGYYETMAATAKLSQAVRRGTSILIIARNCWISAKDFRNLIASLNLPTEGTPDQLREITELLQSLHQKTTELLAISAAKGLTNRTLTASSLQSIKESNVRVLDCIERLQLSLDASILEDARQALEEYRRGESVPLRSLL